jgi:hypothetical protein
MRLRHGPIQSVVKMELRFPSSGEIQPKSLFTIPVSWINIMEHAGIIRIAPAYEQIAQMTGLVGLYLGSKYYPQAVHIDYTAGIPVDEITEDMRQALISRITALILRRLVPGLSQTGTSVSRQIAGLSHARHGGPEMLRNMVADLDLADQQFRSRFKAQLWGPRLLFI